MGTIERCHGPRDQHSEKWRYRIEHKGKSRRKSTKNEKGIATKLLRVFINVLDICTHLQGRWRQRRWQRNRRNPCRSCCNAVAGGTLDCCGNGDPPRGVEAGPSEGRERRYGLAGCRCRRCFCGGSRGRRWRYDRETATGGLRGEHLNEKARKSSSHAALCS